MRLTRLGGVGVVLVVGLVAAWPFGPSAPKRGPSPRHTAQRTLPPSPPEDLSAIPLPDLRPGMSRAEVEDRLGSPQPTDLQPVGDVNGRATYQAAYPLEFCGAHRPPVPLGPLNFVACEFDATLPGHPLINVRYSDPLF